MKLYRLTIHGSRDDQIVSYTSALSHAVVELEKAGKLASVTAGRIERAIVEKVSKTFMLRALNNQHLGVDFEPIIAWDRATGMVEV